jgi:hypothetical protein
VRGVAGAHQPLAHAACDESRALRPGEDLQRGVALEEQAGGVLQRAHGEGGRQAGQQRRVPEGLPGLERLDDLVAVDELHGAGVDHEQVLCGLAVLDQRALARRVGTLGNGAGEPLELGHGEAVERSVAGQERCELGGRRQAADSTRASSTTR